MHLTDHRQLDQLAVSPQRVRKRSRRCADLT